MTFIRQERHGQTALVSFARPPVNAFNLALVEELSACLRELAADPPDGGLVITGDGGVFSSGMDFREVPLYSAEQHAEMVGHINGALTALYGLPTATVAAVSGHAIGGAFVTMLACDFRLAADVEGKLALTEVTAGIPYPACPMEIVKAEMEPGLRRNLVLSGDAIGPAAARDHGIIDELVEPGVLDRAGTRARPGSGRRVGLRGREGAAAARCALADAGDHQELERSDAGALALRGTRILSGSAAGLRTGGSGGR